MNDEKLSANEIQATSYYNELADTIFPHADCMDKSFSADATSLN